MPSTNFQVNGTDFNNIFAMNSSDYYYNKTVAGYSTTGVTLKYNGVNGSTTQQNNIPYYYNNGATNYSNGIQAYYTEYSSGTNTITIPTACNSLGVFLIGAGGSGGAGGGDDTGKQGTNGAGGGGGAYLYTTVDLSTTGKSGWTVTIGTGGTSVSGGDSSSGDSNNGYNGNNGTATTLYQNSTLKASAAYGGGGGGGHPSAGATAGSGGSTGGSAVSDGSDGSTSITAGASGYQLWYNYYYKDSSLYPYLYTLYGSGNGGAGTSGGYDPNESPTGAGSNGYARIYYMV